MLLLWEHMTAHNNENSNSNEVIVIVTDFFFLSRFDTHSASSLSLSLRVADNAIRFVRWVLC